MPPFEHAVRSKFRSIVADLQTNGVKPTEICYGISMALCDIISAYSVHSYSAATELITEIQTEIARQLAISVGASHLLTGKGLSFERFDANKVDEETASQAYYCFKCYVDDLTAVDSEEDQVNWGLICQMLTDAAIDLDTNWFNVSAFSTIVRETCNFDGSEDDTDLDNYPSSRPH